MMTMPALVTVAWLAQATLVAQGQAPASVAPAAPARELVVVVSAPVYLPDGSIRSETIALPASGSGLVHVYSRKTLCAPAAAGAVEPTDAAFGWRIASHVVARSDADVVVSLDWRRVWDAGRKIGNGPGGTVQLTLHAGDRIPLDHIPNGAPSADCRAVGLGLEVKLSRTATGLATANSPLPLGAMPGGAKPVDADLWLTHTSPGGSEQVVHQLVRLTEAGGRFAFAQTPVTTSRGDMNLELAGSIDRFRTPTGVEFFSLSLNRVVTGADLPAAGLSATTGVVTPMPDPNDPNDSVSFQLLTAPGARGGGGGGRGGGGARGAVMVGAAAGGGTGAAGAGAATAGTAAGGGGRGGGVARSGGGGAVAAGSAGNGTTVNLAQLATLLEGHQFSLAIRVAPVR
jgi:hypothetical protein